jgi:predicted DsbA family dithiol-disulfide isomerase
MRVTLYLDVVSSWCYWAEPAWASLQQHFAGRATFDWKISIIGADAVPPSRASLEWFYRRSGTVMRSEFMLNSGWYEPEAIPCWVPNLVAEAGKRLGITDDRLRLALAHAALREGRRVLQWDEAIAIAAENVGLDRAELRARAQSGEIRASIEASTAEFQQLGVTQRPTFVIDDEIGDRAVFSGLVRAEPLIATMEAMANDVAAYKSFAAHFGPPVLE